MCRAIISKPIIPMLMSRGRSNCGITYYIREIHVVGSYHAGIRNLKYMETNQEKGMIFVYENYESMYEPLLIK